MDPVRFVVYSDYLCPWCYNGSRRLRQVRDELAGHVELEWRAFLLRPEPRAGRDRERFRAYTQSWLRPAAEPDAGEFRVWDGDADPPSHSVPPQRVARAAAALGPEAFERMHERLLHAYFAENRDVSAPEVLADLWREAGLPPADLALAWEPETEAAVRAEHAAALASGVSGVPAVRLAGNDAVIVGAQPLELYRRWARRALDGRC